MTATEMITEFGLRYASEINLSVPGWEDDEILSFLNNSQKNTVDKLFKEQGELALAELIDTIPTTQISVISLDTQPIRNAHYFEITGTMPSWRFIASVHCTMSRSDASFDSTDKMMANEIQLPIAHHLIETDLNRPYFREVYWFLTNETLDYSGSAPTNAKQVGILRDAFTTVTDLEIRYIKQPDTLVTGTPGSGETNTSELHERFHDLIVDRAVELAIEALMNPRIKTQPQIVKEE